MKLPKFQNLIFVVIALGMFQTHGEIASKTAFKSASPEQFEVLLDKAKVLHSKGEATYYSADIEDDWKLFKPFLIVVRHDTIEFFLNSDLAAPMILRLTRMTGTWSPTSSRWTVTLKRPGEAKFSELWSRAAMISLEEAEQARRYREYRDSLKPAESGPRE